MKVLCILSDNFEELEAVGTIALLRRAGIEIDVYALNATQATGRFQITLSDLKDLHEVHINDYNMLFLSGGPHYQTLENNQRVMEIIKTFLRKKRWLRLSVLHQRYLVELDI